MVSLAVVMSAARTVFRQFQKIAIASSILLCAGCFANSGGNTAQGEQHDVPYPVNDSFVLTQDVLRGEGILFEVNSDDKLTTLWKDADKGPGMLGSLVEHPRYRYEIEVVPNSARTSRIVVNVRTEDIPDQDIARYQATTRLNLFGKVDALAAKFPPSGGTPKEGGVNYALLPNEDLRGLARRATGDANNWRQIAQDNGLKSLTDGANLPSIWIRNTLLKSSPGDN